MINIRGSQKPRANQNKHIYLRKIIECYFHLYQGKNQTKLNNMLFRHNVIKLCQKRQEDDKYNSKNISLGERLGQVDGVVGRCKVIVMFWS